jgi:hypothetical protein
MWFMENAEVIVDICEHLLLLYALHGTDNANSWNLWLYAYKKSIPVTDREGP